MITDSIGRYRDLDLVQGQRDSYYHDGAGFRPDLPNPLAFP